MKNLKETERIKNLANVSDDEEDIDSKRKNKKVENEK